MRQGWVFSVFTFFVVLSGSGPLLAETLYVDRHAAGAGNGSSWEDAFTSISAALLVSASGTEIWVRSATYEESVVLVEGVALYGGFPVDGSPEWSDRDWSLYPSIIDAASFETHAVVGAEHASMDGFTITGGSYHKGAGIYCEDASPEFANCTIRDNHARFWPYPDEYFGVGGGIYCRAASPSLVDCIIENNRSDQWGGALYCTQESSPTFLRCLIVECRADSGAAVYCNASSPAFTNCTIARSESPKGGAVYCRYPPSALFVNCILWNRGLECLREDGGDATFTYCCLQSGWPGEGNITAFPLFADPDRGDYSLRNGSPCIDRATDTGHPYLGAAPDIGAIEAPAEYVSGPPDHVPTVHFVRRGLGTGGNGTGWYDPFFSIAAALERSGTSDEIRVMAGTYNENIVLEPGVTLLGGFPTDGSPTLEMRNPGRYVTRIDASGKDTHVVAGGWETVLDGFTVTGASLESLWEANGGGVYCYRSSLALRSCRITDNDAETGYEYGEEYGGGIYCEESSVTIESCTIDWNTAGDHGGGICCHRSTVTLRDSTVQLNTGGFGGGIDCWGEAVLNATGCTIDANAASLGGGINASGKALVGLRDCRIAMNWGGGLRLSWGAALSATRCEITSNGEDNDGGAVSCTSSSADFVHCSLVDNHATYDGGIAASGSSVTLVNSILWNLGAELTPSAVDHATLTHCCVQGGLPGTENFDALPRFEDRDGLDLRPADGSPCIDAGIDIGLQYNGAAPDVGAYEAPEGFSPGPRDHQPSIIRVALGSPPGGDGSSWAEAVPNIREAFEISSTSDELWLKAGTYSNAAGEITSRDVPGAMEPGCEVYGGFAGSESLREERNWMANQTILMGTPPSLPWNLGQADNAVIDGLVFYGWSIRCYPASPTIRNCTIQRGRFYCRESSPTAVNCTFQQARVECYSASPLLADCRIHGNFVSYGGGIYCYDSFPSLINCLIAGNEAFHGGGVWVDTGSPFLLNCTITGNTASNRAGGIGSVASRDAPRLVNCIVFGNTPNEVFFTDVGPSITWSDVAGGYAGTGNIDADPGFVHPWDGEYGDFRLLPSSPCIDAGSNDAVLDIPLDLAGNLRIWDGDDVPGAVVDMGAFEYASVSPTPTLTPSPQPTPSPTPPTVDLDGNGVIDAVDLFLFSRQWHRSRN